MMPSVALNADFNSPKDNDIVCRRQCADDAKPHAVAEQAIE